MNVYHKVLVRLYEATGGRDTNTVDFKDLVKAQGFHGNYEDIFQQLSVQGWIVETPKANFVKITHWGVKEAQKALSGAGEPDDSRALNQIVNRVINETREFLTLLEEFAAAASKEKFAPVEKKFGELNAAIDSLKESI